jgi:hypothetical protein
MVGIPESSGAPGCGSDIEFARSFDVPVLLRRIEERDRPWLVDLCKRRYSHIYDAGTADAWLTNIALKNPIQYYPTRTANAFQVTNLTTTPWAPSRFKADIVLICADKDKIWEALSLLRDSIQWARDRRACEWRFETETEFDLKILMQKLGATELTPRYRLDLRGS